MTVLIDMERVSSVIGRDAATFAAAPGPAGLAAGEVCCGLPSPEGIGSAGPPDGGVVRIIREDAALCSQTTGGRMYFSSPTLTENFCAAYFCVPATSRNQHCQEAPAVALIR